MWFCTLNATSGIAPIAKAGIASSALRLHRFGRQAISQAHIVAASGIRHRSLYQVGNPAITKPVANAARLLVARYRWSRFRNTTLESRSRQTGPQSNVLVRRNGASVARIAVASTAATGPA